MIFKVGHSITFFWKKWNYVRSPHSRSAQAEIQRIWIPCHHPLATCQKISRPFKARIKMRQYMIIRIWKKMSDLRSTLWFMVQQYLPKGQIHNISVTPDSIPKKLSEPQQPASEKSQTWDMVGKKWFTSSVQLPSFFNRAIVFGTYVFKSPEECLEFHWGRLRKFCIEVRHSQWPFQKSSYNFFFSDRLLVLFGSICWKKSQLRRYQKKRSLSWVDSRKKMFSEEWPIIVEHFQKKTQKNIS